MYFLVMRQKKFGGELLATFLYFTLLPVSVVVDLPNMDLNFFVKLIIVFAALT